MKIEFTKMHGIGNDFVVLDGINQTIQLNNGQLRFLADRHFGVGCDQILLVEESRNPDVDFRYRIFNADGGEVAQCGNGARCFARYVRQKGLTDKQQICVETNNGNMVLQVINDNLVKVDMGIPRLKPADIPLDITQQTDKYQLSLNRQNITFGAVSMGNPHMVMEVDNIEAAPVATLGADLESHVCFPERANIGFMQIVNRNHIRLRVFERGSAETLACGSGACAAVVVGHIWGLLDDKVTVSLPGGDLEIEWEGADSSVYLLGPASFVFDAEIEIPKELD